MTNLTNALCPEVGNESFGDANAAVGLLVLLNQCHIEAWEGCARSVEGVADLIFAIGILKAEAHPAGLVVAEARTR